MLTYHHYLGFWGQLNYGFSKVQFRVCVAHIRQEITLIYKIYKYNLFYYLSIPVFICCPITINKTIRDNIYTNNNTEAKLQPYTNKTATQAVDRISCSVFTHAKDCLRTADPHLIAQRSIFRIFKNN